MAQRIFQIAVSTSEPARNRLWINPYEGVARIHNAAKGWLVLQGPLFAQINGKVDSEVATLTGRIESDEKNIQTNAENIKTNAEAIATNTESIKTNADTIAANTESIKTNAEAIDALEKSKQDKLTAGYGLEIGSDGTISITLDTTLFKFVTTLPDKPAEEDENKIFVVPSDTAEEGNEYAEYYWADGKWEELDKFKPDISLDDYYTKEETDTLLAQTQTATEANLESAVSDLEKKIEGVTEGLSDYYTKEETDKEITRATENLATNEQLDSYLPLAGGTLSGDLHIGGATIQASDGHIVLPSGIEIY